MLRADVLAMKSYSLIEFRPQEEAYYERLSQLLMAARSEGVEEELIQGLSDSMRHDLPSLLTRFFVPQEVRSARVETFEDLSIAARYFVTTAHVNAPDPRVVAYVGSPRSDPRSCPFLWVFSPCRAPGIDTSALVPDDPLDFFSRKPTVLPPPLTVDFPIYCEQRTFRFRWYRRASFIEITLDNFWTDGIGSGSRTFELVRGGDFSNVDPSWRGIGGTTLNAHHIGLNDPVRVDPTRLAGFVRIERREHRKRGRWITVPLAAHLS